VDATTGSVMVRLIFPNPRGLLLPGMFVRAVVSEGVNEAAILLPQQAVSQDTKGNPVVLVVDAQGKVEQRRVVLDRAVDDKWLVVSGLTAGERVVVEGIQKARPGSLVKAVPFVPAGGAPAAPPPAAAGKKP
jgi:membrane fusion protein (multidrug efflux system)